MGDKLSLANVLVLGAFIWAIFNPQKVEELVAKLKPGPAVVEPSVELPAEYRQLAEQAARLMSVNPKKARSFRGYFQALSDEALENEYLKTTVDIQQLVERSAGRLNEVVDLPSASDGKELAEVLEKMLDTAVGGKDVKSLDSAIRGRVAEAFEAMEWAVIEASK